MKITVIDRFIAPCPEYPNGAWFRKIGSKPWELFDEQCPIVIIPKAKDEDTTA